MKIEDPLDFLTASSIPSKAFESDYATLVQLKLANNLIK